MVDGHNSHYTLGFLRYAKDHNIHVLCYPSHATHVYQGLDVVVFSPLKKCFREEKDEHRRETGENLSRKNFLKIYGRAHLRAMQPETIKSAFRKTGVAPLNRHVISPEMMAPSKDTAMGGTQPVIPATPVRAVAKLLGKFMMVKNDIPEAPSHSELSDSESEELPTIGVPPSCGRGRMRSGSDPIESE